jgi:hypothetical protein
VDAFEGLDDHGGKPDNLVLGPARLNGSSRSEAVGAGHDGGPPAVVGARGMQGIAIALRPKPAGVIAPELGTALVEHLEGHVLALPDSDRRRE